MANPESAGMDSVRLQALEDRVAQDVEEGLYYGAAIKVARHGETVADFAIGHADGEKSNPLTRDSVFSVFSITKAFVNVLVLRWIELGRLALTTPVVEIIPEFKGAPRDRATVFHMLTHTAGMPGVWEPKPGMFLDDLDEVLEAVLQNVHGIVEPGSRCDYAPMVNHVLLAVMLSRTDPERRPIDVLLREEVFLPLGMQDTALGIKPWMRERHVFPDPRGTFPIKLLSKNYPGDIGLHGAESNQAPWAGAASTTADLHAFVDMLRRGGRNADGYDLVSPTTLLRARQNWTGTMPNELYQAVALRAGYQVPPAYMGLGFNVRGEGMLPTQLGTLTSRHTFGNYGAGSCLFWVDPELDLSFVALTAGLLPQAANIARFQRLSDLAVAAAR